jgi:hypothetical protein
MKYWLAILACTLLMGGLYFMTPVPAAQAQTPDPLTPQVQATPADTTDAATAELAGLLESALQNRVDSLAPLIFDITIDHVTYSNDGQVAAMWVAMRDPQNGEVVATEPSLVIARRSPLDPNWSLTLPPDADYSGALEALPEELISDELRETFLAEELLLDEPTGQVFNGYLLPWAGGANQTPFRQHWPLPDLQFLFGILLPLCLRLRRRHHVPTAGRQGRRGVRLLRGLLQWRRILHQLPRAQGFLYHPGDLPDLSAPGPRQHPVWPAGEGCPGAARPVYRQCG